MCSLHPGYKGKRRPRSACPKCWTIYGYKHPETTAGKVVKAVEGQLGAISSRQVAALLLVLPDKFRG